MNQVPSIDFDDRVETLLNHLHERTFGRLHDLSITQSSNGRLHVSAVAHSRFVGQLAEWAVLERLSASDVHLSISVCTPTRHYREIPK